MSNLPAKRKPKYPKDEVEQLKAAVEENTQVVHEKKGEFKEVLKEGREIQKPLNFPNDQQRVVGVSLGCTRNVGDYESLRADAWVSSVAEKGWEESELEYLYGLVGDFLDKTVNAAVEKILEEKETAKG